MARVDSFEERQRPPGAGERIEWLPQVGAFEVRPLTASDHEAYCAFAARLEREDLRMRFAGLVNLDCAKLERLIAHASSLGLLALTAQVLSENMPMLRLARAAGFRSIGRSGFLIDMAKKMRCSKAGLPRRRMPVPEQGVCQAGDPHYISIKWAAPEPWSRCPRERD